MYCLPSEVMDPHVGVDTGTPAPRKLSDASTKMTNPTRRLPMTSVVLKVPGNMCLNTIRHVVAPATRASLTYSSSLS